MCFIFSTTALVIYCDAGCVFPAPQRAAPGKPMFTEPHASAPPTFIPDSHSVTSYFLLSLTAG